MLDVHPAHHAASTWRDFFIHIATIVIGLLIAIGLEQTVEFFHHRNEVRETRKALAVEREENRRSYAVNVADWNLALATLKNNLRILLYRRDHPSAAEEDLPGTLRWGFGYEPTVQSVWRNAQQTQVLSFFPAAEAEKDTDLYMRLVMGEDQAKKAYFSQAQAAKYAVVDPDITHMRPEELDETIVLTKQATEDELGWGLVLLNISRSNPDFAPAPSADTIAALLGITRSKEDTERLARPNAATTALLAPLRAARDAAAKAAGDSR